MDPQQQRAVIQYATKHAGEHVTIDAQAGDPEGFDEVDTGVWVRGWIWVPQEAIDGYRMEPPAPASVVEVQPAPFKPMGYSEFKDAYIQAYTEAGDNWTMANLRASWAAYQRDPKGHFLSIMTALNKTIPPDPEGLNGARAEWAELAIQEFEAITGTDREDALADLLCNLQHWCDRNGMDFDNELERGRAMYQDEVR